MKEHNKILIYPIFLMSLYLPIGSPFAKAKSGFLNCESRIGARTAPEFPSHKEIVIKKYGKCTVDLTIFLEENGEISKMESYIENPECSAFVRSAEQSVKEYKFINGRKEICQLKITFELEGYGT